MGREIQQSEACSGRHRCSIHCVMPPYVVEVLLKRAKSDSHREKLLNTLKLSAQNRGMRTAVSRLAFSKGAAEISIFDAHHSEDPSDAVLIWSESKPTELHDPDAVRVRDFTTATKNFYREIFNRNSVDDNGLNLKSYIHFSDGWDNAQWDGSQMEYGDGDGVEFNSFTSSIDIVGHELTHGVTQYTSDLAYRGQSGALNESFSDVMGSLIKQYQARQTVQKADWLIGAGLFKNGDALRSMKKPGTAFEGDIQPVDMDGFVKTTRDHGGVHLNSSIPNRAFYEACVAFDPNLEAWKTIGPVWYAAFTRLSSHASFLAAARATYVQAKHQSEKHADAVRAGWAAVKLDFARL